MRKAPKKEGIVCSSYANCYVGCSCQSDWTQGSVPSSGEYVWATDSRYTGVNALSASNVSDVTSLTDGKSVQSTSGDTQVVSLSGGVSTMGSSGGMTCYKAACPSGYYLDAPNSTYFTFTSTTGTIGLTYYKATGCKDGYSTEASGSAVASYHDFKCYEVLYDCKSWAEAKGKASGIIWDSYTTESNTLYGMKGPETLANEFPECANYGRPTVTFTNLVTYASGTVDSVNLEFTSSGQLETCNFEKHHCCDGRSDGCYQGMPECSDIEFADNAGCCAQGSYCYTGHNAAVQGTLILKNTDITTKATYGISTAASRYSGGTIELHGNVNGTLSTYRGDGKQGSVAKGHVKVVSGTNYIKNIHIYGGYDSGATGTVNNEAEVTTEDVYAYNLFSNGNNWNITCSMFVHGTLKMTKPYYPVNGCTLIHSDGYFETPSMKSSTSSVGTYNSKIAWEAGAKVRINGNCKKASSSGNYTIEGNTTITTNPVTGSGC